MFPIRDHNPSGRTPYIVFTLMALNIIIFMMSLDFRGNEQLLWAHYNQWALFPVRVTEGDGYYALLTSTFLHGGFMHLAGNMLFLWIFGDNLEDQMGHVGFLVFYLICGLGASLLQVMSNPDSAIPVVGASGAIAGVMGGYLLLFPKARIDILLILIIFFRIFTIPAWIMLGVWMGMQIFGGLGSDPETGGVAYWAHGGGFIVGLLLTVPLWISLGGSAFWQRTHGHPDHQPARPPMGVRPWGAGLHPPVEQLRPRPRWQPPSYKDDAGWTPERKPTSKRVPQTPLSRPEDRTIWMRTQATPSVPSTSSPTHHTRRTPHGAPNDALNSPTTPSSQVPTSNMPKVARRSGRRAKSITRRGSPWQTRRK